MKAIQVTQTGWLEVLTLADVPTPTRKANEGLIRKDERGQAFDSSILNL